MEGARPASRTFWLKAQEVNWTPRSEWITRPFWPLRRRMAMPSALSRSVVVWVLSIDQPTTNRENASRPTQHKTLPSRVGRTGRRGHVARSRAPRVPSRRPGSAVDERAVGAAGRLVDVDD